MGAVFLTLQLFVGHMLRDGEVGIALKKARDSLLGFLRLAGLCIGHGQ